MYFCVPQRLLQLFIFGAVESGGRVAVCRLANPTGFYRITRRPALDDDGTGQRAVPNSRGTDRLDGLKDRRPLLSLFSSIIGLAGSTLPCLSSFTAGC